MPQGVCYVEADVVIFTIGKLALLAGHVYGESGSVVEVDVLNYRALTGSRILAFKKQWVADWQVFHLEKKKTLY